MSLQTSCHSARPNWSMTAYTRARCSSLIRPRWKASCRNSKVHVNSARQAIVMLDHAWWNCFLAEASVTAQVPVQACDNLGSGRHTYYFHSPAW